MRDKQVFGPSWDDFILFNWGIIMKKICLATFLLSTISFACADDGILRRYGADGPISSRYGVAGPIPKRSVVIVVQPSTRAQQEHQPTAQERDDENDDTSPATGFEEQHQVRREVRIRSATVTSDGDVIVPSGQGYINTTNGDYYPSAGDHAVINPGDGNIIPVP